MANTSRQRAKNRRNKDRFLSLPHGCLEHQNFVRLKPRAIKLLIDIAAQHDGSNNGALIAPFSEMRKRGWASKQTLARALAELRYYGWIRLVRPGEQLNRVAARYALTWLKLNEHEGVEAKDIGTTPNDWKETKPTWSP